jgi:predicted Rossmann fold flavoprotein
MKFDAIVIGGGAAGLFYAANAGRRARVLLIEHNAQLGRKILVSGGGRCNFTNLNTSADNFISSNRHFAKSALTGYSPSDFVDLVKSYRIDFFEKKLGQLFCRNSSREIVEMLTNECLRAGVNIQTGCSVAGVEHRKDFHVETNKGAFTAPNLVIATGGLSFPKIGATDFGYRIARQFGHRIVRTDPALVPLVVSESLRSPALAGISVDALVSAGQHSFRENILFTHRGLSGPAILQASNYWYPGESIEIDLYPSRDFSEILTENRDSRKHLSNLLARYLPERFATDWSRRNCGDRAVNKMSDNELLAISKRISGWTLEIDGTEGYSKAEVTRGGVDTSEISSKTMESGLVRGLYFIGEVVDVTGWLGGYNFQWAWASAYAAAKSI